MDAFSRKPHKLAANRPYQFRGITLKNSIVACFLSVLTLNAFALKPGDKVLGGFTVETSQGQKIFEIPLPPGEWGLNYVKDRRGTGSSPKMRDYAFGLVENGFLKSAIEITVYVETRVMRWTDEPCKINNPTIIKNDFGTRLWNQKCLSLIPTKFLQGNNEITRSALDKLTSTGVRNDFNALMLTYTRYNDRNKYVRYKQYIFPTPYGLENPLVSVMGNSPWYPTRIQSDKEKSKFIDTLSQYADGLVAAVNTIFEGEQIPAIPDLVYPPDSVKPPLSEISESTDGKDEQVESKLLLLKSLLDKNLISREEFDAKRLEILDSLN